MILIGQYDSPFVRRVGIALTLYQIPFEHRAWSVFGDTEKLREYNPLTRVPTLVLDDGDVIIESRAILDYLDGSVPPARAMFPRAEPSRHRAIKVTELAVGAAEKGVSLYYENTLHEVSSDVWVERCRKQIGGALAMLDSGRRECKTPYWFGERIGHADIAIGALIRFLNEALPDIFPSEAFPALRAHAQVLESLPAFCAIQQAFAPSVKSVHK